MQAPRRGPEKVAFFNPKALEKDLIAMWTERRLLPESTEVYDASDRFTPKPAEIMRVRQMVQDKRTTRRTAKDSERLKTNFAQLPSKKREPNFDAILSKARPCLKALLQDLGGDTDAAHQRYDTLEDGLQGVETSGRMNTTSTERRP